jgi:hypothetical protein
MLRPDEGKEAVDEETLHDAICLLGQPNSMCFGYAARYQPHASTVCFELSRAIAITFYAAKGWPGRHSADRRH